MSGSLLWLSAIPITIGLVYGVRALPFLSGLAVLIGAWIMYNVIQRIFSMFELHDLENRAVFISGCDTGFGHHLAIKCLKRGMPVFAGCLTESGAEALRKEPAALSGKLDTMIVDVSSDESVASAAKYLEQATKQYGGLHGVVNNAGLVGNSFLDDFLNIHDYEKVVNVNTFGAIRLTQALKHLVKLKRGRIVTIASSCARVGMPGMGPYTVSKYAVSGYCEVVRQELAPFGVSLSIIEPGFFRTPLIDEARVQAGLNRVWDSTPLNVKDIFGKQFFMETSEAGRKYLHGISSPRVHLVVDAYFHALTARFPHNRYQVGWDIKWIFAPMSYLPAGLRDALAAVAAKMSGAPVPHQAIAKYRTLAKEIKMPTNPLAKRATPPPPPEPKLGGIPEEPEIQIEPNEKKNV